MEASFYQLIKNMFKYVFLPITLLFVSFSLCYNCKGADSIQNRKYLSIGIGPEFYGKGDVLLYKFENQFTVRWSKLFKSDFVIAFGHNDRNRKIENISQDDDYENYSATAFHADLNFSLTALSYKGANDKARGYLNVGATASYLYYSFAQTIAVYYPGYTQYGRYDRDAQFMKQSLMGLGLQVEKKMVFGDQYVIGFKLVHQRYGLRNIFHPWSSNVSTGLTLSFGFVL